MWSCCPCFSKTYEVPEVLELDYRHCSLAEVPAEVFIYERTLEKLDLASNQITELSPSLFHCHELINLDLSDNELMSIPTAIGSLTRLRKLDLSRNAITEIADGIKSCKNLNYVDLSMNHLTKLPEGISQLMNLDQLFLNDTYLEFLHANFGRLAKLKVLEIRENTLQSLPKSMNRLHHLERLDIGQNGFVEMPEVIGTMTKLTELWCDNNGIQQIPAFIGKLTELTCMDFSNNELDEVAPEISNCMPLTDVSLSGNKLKKLPATFPKLENLSVLRLDYNVIEILPEDFGKLKNLQELSLVTNQLTKLPASIGLLRKLHTLYLDANYIEELPKEIGSCTALSILSITDNQLKEIPSEVGHLNNLKVFTLSGNQIVHLPVSMISMTGLCALWLSETQSQPLHTLIQEIDPTTGQHVATCLLLPQQTIVGNSIGYNTYLPKKKKDERRIKFQDMAPQTVENNVTRRGLLRAPTPYPKDLKVLAKQASNLRHSKEQNGDVVNTDEPEYEGDDDIEEASQNVGSESVHGAGSTATPSTKDAPRNYKQKNLPSPIAFERPPVAGKDQNTSHFSFPTKLAPVSASNHDTPERLPHLGKETIGLPTVPSTSQNKGFPVTAAMTYSTSSSSQQPLTVAYSNMMQLNQNDDSARNSIEIYAATNDSTRFAATGPEVPDKATRETYGNTGSEMARKSPPPYHVAARRAAFFRSSGGAGSSRIASPTPDVQQQAQVNPLIGIRIFPLTGPADHNIGPPPVTQIPTIHSTSNVAPINMPFNVTETSNRLDTENNVCEPDFTEGNLELNEEDQEVTLNRTYTISKEANEDSSDIVSSMEENLNDGATPELSEHPINSKTLVETIDTALESVDKRTTEFLRNDGWQKQDELKGNVLDSQYSAELDFSTAPSVRPSNNVSTAPTETNDFVELESGLNHRPPYSGIPTVASAYSLRGPVPPPKPSPQMSRSATSSLASPSMTANLNESASSSSSKPNPTAGLSKMESYSKIPMFSSNQSKSMSGQSFSSQIPSLEMSTSSSRSVVSSQNSVSKQQNASYKSLSYNKVETNMSTSVTDSITSPGVESRIPKLPSFSTTSASALPGTQHEFKKPEIPASKPMIARTAVSSRIPSFGPSDSKGKDSVKVFSTNSTSNPVLSPQSVPSAISNTSGRQINHTQRPPLANPNIPTGNVSTGSSTRIPRFGEPSPEKQDLKRSGSGTRIPKVNDNSRTSSPAPSAGSGSTDNAGILPENNNHSPSSLSNIPTAGGTKIPSFGNRKPWIFGTHKNARVVPVEFRKINALGFQISDATGAGQPLDGQGIYVVSTDSHDSTIKVGDKILQVDGIDVANMGLEIVKKILGNCQENINLLVSRQS